MTLTIHLTFGGNCREAFELYRSAFGGEFALISTYREGPPHMGVPETELDRIMHVSFAIGSSVLLGGDAISADGPGPTAGNIVAISFSAESREKADQVFARLSEGGTIETPMGEVFWGAYYGNCVDRFGVNWQVIAEHGQG